MAKYKHSIATVTVGIKMYNKFVFGSSFSSFSARFEKLREGLVKFVFGLREGIDELVLGLGEEVVEFVVKLREVVLFEIGEAAVVVIAVMEIFSINELDFCGVDVIWFESTKVIADLVLLSFVFDSVVIEVWKLFQN